MVPIMFCPGETLAWFNAGLWTGEPVLPRWANPALQLPRLSRKGLLDLYKILRCARVLKTTKTAILRPSPASAAASSFDAVFDLADETARVGDSSEKAWQQNFRGCRKRRVFFWSLGLDLPLTGGPK
ncbi:MAG: hypothetical protein BM558_12395 [Roseobacter sp. MedPE-SW]|nr:MAG: hypothetical protein BM558_12395 [Roseobacter sp. MedPE-SW]